MFSSYREYLQSSHWKELRSQAIIRWGDRCSNCSVPGVDVHHLRYGNLLDVTTDDLMPLCRRCHESVHQSKVITSHWNSNTPSEEKRRTVLVHLAARDEVSKEFFSTLEKERARIMAELKITRSEMDEFLRSKRSKSNKALKSSKRFEAKRVLSMSRRDQVNHFINEKSKTY